MNPITAVQYRARSLVFGLTLPVTAFRLILSSKKLMLWSIIPIVITLGLYIWVIGSLQDFVHQSATAYFQSIGWDPQGWAVWLLLFLTRIALILLGAITFAFSASIAASPFNDFLAESAEALATPPLPKVENSSWRFKVRLVWIDLGKSIAALIMTIAAVLLSWVPIINVIAFTLAFLMLTFQFTSYPQTRRGIGFRQGISFLWKHAYACVGFGAALSFLFAIPLLSILVLPLAVVGGTLLVSRAQGGQLR